MTKIRILIVENDLIIASHISKIIIEAGYKVAEILTKGESVNSFLKDQQVDLILMDIQLAGELDGIETGKLIAKTYKTPIIFLTGNSDRATFQRSKEAYPYAFINKPFKNDDLLRSLELVFNQVDFLPVKPEPENAVQLKDRIFVRDKTKLIKLNLNEVLYVEADRNYCKITTSKKEYTLSVPLLRFEQKVSSDIFVRIHRSHLANIKAIDEMDEHYVFIKGKALAISKKYKDSLTSKLKVV